MLGGSLIRRGSWRINVELDDMYHACLLIHGPPPPQWRTTSANIIITGEFFNYRTDVDASTDA